MQGNQKSGSEGIAGAIIMLSFSLPFLYFFGPAAWVMVKQMFQ